ncbi:hypothetical protein [Noviherbaspirillum denitrificans]|uniref:Lipoprotein n=1 Tax=Noviherbaspirillum denitrificans TaxID=1968433 RepID=A0A254TGW6_9BURK|nr:hypothetical protein [Noviherbaspirillum denitrificans]OWW21896.1 hypothetical protein AYR66_22775 [Noviherbaspirillum denitrificans]
MKKILCVLIIMLTAGCSGMGRMNSSGYSSGASGSGPGTDNTYRPNFNPAFERMDSSFQPYFGG